MSRADHMQKKFRNRRQTKQIAGRRVRNIAIIILLVMLTALIILRISAKTIQAEDITENHYKYFTSITIEQGDSLWSLAENYLTEDYKDIYSYIDEVKSINHLSGDSLIAGQKLCIPYYAEEYKE